MKIAATILAIVVTAVLALAIHICAVTRPQAAGRSRGMARIDLHQTVSPAEARKIVAWLYTRKGVDHALVNPRSATAVFTYLPAIADPGRIADVLRDSLSYPHAVRYLPTAAAIRRSCPMTATPVTNRIYTFLKRIF
ncbi:MAG TPA: hypothetical protein VN616_18070 [Puia sp.]|nr:hypothetical protein [Puia sp.]